jgi:GAF domain-containing protein
MRDLRPLHEDLARVVTVDRDLSEILQDITTVTRRSTPDLDAVSITLIRGSKPFTVAYDGDVALVADELQYARGYGPCIDAGLAGQPFLIDDMASDERWPDYCRAATERGVGGSLSMPLPFQGTAVGALNCYSRQAHAIDEDDRLLAEEVALWVGLALGKIESALRSREELDNLKIAMTSRAVIDQAKGILMERLKVTEEGAFAVLSHLSQQTNIKLRDIAEQLVTTGVLRDPRR